MGNIIRDRCDNADAFALAIAEDEAHAGLKVLGLELKLKGYARTIACS